MLTGADLGGSLDIDMGGGIGIDLGVDWYRLKYRLRY